MARYKSYLIGIDGGATHTRGIITQEDGIELATITGGSTNQYTNTLDVVKWNLQTIVQHLLKKVKAESTDVRGVCLGLAGVDKPSDARRISQVASSLLPQTDINVVNDSVIALYGGTLKPYGIIVISGTGSIVYGQNIKGVSCRTGGWGHILGDEGSGYSIALNSLRAVARAADGRAAATLLADAILGELHLDNPVELMEWVKQAEGDKAKISSLAPLVFRAAEHGDAVAMHILRAESEELRIAIYTVYKKLFKPADGDIEVVVGGSNLCKNKMYFDILKERTEKKHRHLRVIEPHKSPLHGAILFLQNKYRLVDAR